MFWLFKIVDFKSAIFLYLVIWLYGSVTAEHRTKEALQKLSDLYCFRCDTMVDGDRCQDLKENATSFNVKCLNEQRTCKVKSISMSASTEDVTGKPKLWLLQRNCTKTCEPGCIVIGERTKLHSCTTCCENSFCNTGSGSEGSMMIALGFKELFLSCFLLKRLLLLFF